MREQSGKPGNFFQDCIFNQETPKVFEILKGFELEHHWDNFFRKETKLELEVLQEKHTLVLNEFLISKTEDVAIVGMVAEGWKVIR